MRLWDPIPASCVICDHHVYAFRIGPHERFIYCHKCKAARDLSSDGRVAKP